ncbi:MAG: Fic family protein [Chloroflexota bacterium]|nr:Fic family protein [Chloroflexota bacterium]
MLESRLHQRLQSKKKQLDQLRPLPDAAVRRLQEQLMVEWIYNSNAIEGNTLTLRETQLILETGLTIGGKSLREHFEVINHRDAIQYVESLVAQTKPITPFHVRQIHQLVLKEIDSQNAGQYRQSSVRIAGADHQPPDAWQVAHLMDEWSVWLNDSAQPGNAPEDTAPEDTILEDTIVRAALAHHRLTAIHPFIDGNGRTARLLMNLLLLRAGYPPTIILRTNRRQYYRVLAAADAGHDAPIVNFVGQAVERSLTLYLEACTPQSKPPKQQETWIPLREAARATPYSQEYLSLLARTGRLEAIKRGRVWYTSQNAISAYQASLGQP